MINKRYFLKIFAGFLGVNIMASHLPSNSYANSKNADYWLPDEADPHLRTFMQWPVNDTIYSDPIFLNMVQQSIADIANTISQFEPVIMLMDKKYEKQARKKLTKSIEIWDIATDDLWCRDSGPVFVKTSSGNLAVSSLNFNGWGNKQTHGNDSKIAKLIASRLELPFFNNGLVGEAGGVETNSKGVLLAHESSWINKNRNAGSKDEIEKLLLEAIGGQKIIWAKGIKGEDITDYHIDSLARFTGDDNILIQLPKVFEKNDIWSRAAFETYDILKNATNFEGKKFKITTITEPESTRIKSNDFVASYVNYYLCNGALIAAQYGDKKADEEAKQILSSLYPNREIVMLNIDSIGEIGGGIHCATQQQPLI